jgi:hypothetical protein
MKTDVVLHFHTNKESPSTGCCIGSSVRWKSEGLQDRLLNCCSSITESYKGFPMDGALVCAVSHYPIKLL